MKDESFELLQTPVSSCAPCIEAGDPFDAMTSATRTSISSEPLVSADRPYEETPAEHAALGPIFLTMFCSVLGWMLLYAREILAVLGTTGYFVGSTLAGLLHVLR